MLHNQGAFYPALLPPWSTGGSGDGITHLRAV